MFEERQKPDHHFVSEYIMRTYFDEDNWSYMKNVFEKQFAILPNHVKTSHNEGTLEQFHIDVHMFAKTVFSEIIRKFPVTEGLVLG